MRSCVVFTWLCVTLATTAAAGPPVQTAAQLVAAVRDAGDGQTVEIAPGTYELAEPLELKTGVTLRGAGMDETILTHVTGWNPSTATLPDPEMTTKGLDRHAYLIRLNDNASRITIGNLTLRGPQIHGAIFGWANDNLHVHDLRIDQTRWCGIRTFAMTQSKIVDCEFIDAGGRWKNGQPGIRGGITGGAIFAIWMKDCEIAHNRFTRTRTEKEHEFYGVKCRQAKRCRVHHNSIDVNFSMEFPFENDEDVEIDHNVCSGAISIPKFAGGPVPPSGRTFHIHHNYFRDSYSIEFVRNGVEIDHNLFDFDAARDHGNLISGFGKKAAAGPAEFHSNLVRNPGRGVIWINEPYSNLTIRNNHIIAATTSTPRTEGLFGFHPECDFQTIQIHHNRIECIGQSRPLLRKEETYAAIVRDNHLVNVSDSHRFTIPTPDATVGPEMPLHFRCGVHGERTIDGWTNTASPRAATGNDP